MTHMPTIAALTQGLDIGMEGFFVIPIAKCGLRI